MGKDSKGGRGKTSGRGSGHRMHIANEDELEIRNREVKEHNAARRTRREEEGDDDDEDNEEEQTVEGAEVHSFVLIDLVADVVFRRLVIPYLRLIELARKSPTLKEMIRNPKD